jgi:hypothetical protein
MPPTNTPVVIPTFAPNCSITPRIWSASSRVGASTMTRVPSRAFGAARWRRSNIGSVNASVFPVPVGARAIKSRPIIAGPIDLA